MDALAFVLVLIVITVPLLVVWGLRQARSMRISCQRCGYVGRSLGMRDRTRGVIQVCPRCRGETWVRA